MKHQFFRRVLPLVPATLLAGASLLFASGCDESGEEDAEVVAQLVVVDQDVEANNEINVSVVELSRPNGFVAIYEDAGGARGGLIGSALVDEEIELNLTVTLSRGITSGETLHAALHLDDNESGALEPDADPIAIDRETGEEVARTFVPTINVGDLEVTLQTSDANYDPDDDRNEVRIDEATVIAATWVVVYEDAGFNNVIGQEARSPGRWRNFDIALNRDVANGDTLYVRLHGEGGGSPTQFDMGPDAPLVDESGAEYTGVINVTVEVEMRDPALVISDQVAAPPTQIIVDSLYSEGPGAVVIHADDGSGGLGEELGAATVDAGDQSNVVVTLSREAMDGETLRGRLHADEGAVGMWEPGTDPAQQAGGNDVIDEFVVSVMQITPAVDVAAVPPLDELSTVLTVPGATSPGPGWVVIHLDDAGSPGTAIGQAGLVAGDNTNVEVLLDRPAADGQTLHAMLHSDEGTIGVWEPGTDAPVDDGAGVIVSSFTATVPMGVPAVRIDVDASSNADYTFMGYYPPTVPDPGAMGTDPVLTFVEGWRYEIVNNNSGNHPFEFISEGAMVPDDDVVHASQTGAGSLDADADVNWTNDVGTGTARFTVTPTFSAAVTKYRCLIHKVEMRGNVMYMAAP